MNIPVKICYVIDTLHRGGTELQLAGLVSRLDPTAFTPTLVTLKGYTAEVVPPGVPHWHLNLRGLVRPRGVATLMCLASQLRRQRFAIVQTFFQDATLLGGMAARIAGVPVRLASFRDLGFWRSRGQDVALRAIYRGMTGFVANSAAARDHFCKYDGIDPARVAVIPNGIDSERIPFNPPAKRPGTVGIVGNLNRPVKRIDLFVEAAARVAASRSDVRWEIVGDGKQRDELVALAHARGLEGRIVFHGRITDVPAVLAGWDIGVLCSDSEGFSNALLEYMLAGCAVVATDVGGNREAVVDGHTGLLVPVDDAAALATAVERLLADGGLCGQLAAAARQDVTTRYGWEACVSAHVAYYRHQLERHAGSRS